MTDVQLKYTKDGKFRQFAFIGYKTEEQAKLAQSYFNEIFIDTCKISVEQCANLGIIINNHVIMTSEVHKYDMRTFILYILGDPSKPRSWSKYASDSSYNKANGTSDSKSKEKSTDSVEKNNIEKTKSKSDVKKKRTDTHKKENDEVKKALERVY